MHRCLIARLAWVLVLCPSMATPGFAQQGDRVAGQVIDGRSLPIVSARVSVVGTTSGANTDREGRFRITGLTGPSVTLLVQRIGYAEARQTVSVGDLRLSIVLTDVAVSLNQVVVTGTAGGAERRAVGNWIGGQIAGHFDAVPLPHLFGGVAIALAGAAIIMALLTRPIAAITARR